jgi:uncharacterized protein YndB with AHSA1/START domain
VRLLAIIGGAVVGLIAVIAAIAVGVGYTLPEKHVATGVAIIPAPPDSVWKTITEVSAYPSWRKDVKRVEVLPASDGRVAWREHSGDDVIPMEVVEGTPPSRLVVRIASDSLPFGGAWTYELAPSGTGTRVQITENGIVYNPLFRFVSRYLMGQTKTIDDYLHALGKRYGADVETTLTSGS